MNNKIGIGIITCDRPDYLWNLIESLHVDELQNYNIDELIVIDDGKEPLSTNTEYDFSNVKQIRHTPGRQGVGKTKNDAMDYLLKQGCEHIFIIEDDVRIKNLDVFNQYIQAAKASGILHFNYGPGTPFNRVQTQVGDVHNRHLLEQNSKPNPRLIIDYKDVKIALYQHIAGTFSYFHDSVLKKVGLIDEQFYNAWDHVEHTYRILKAGYHPPFWWFADLANSDDLLEIQSAALEQSSIAKSDEWYKNLYEGREKYKKLHGWYPNETPSVPQASVVQILKALKKVK